MGRLRSLIFYVTSFLVGRAALFVAPLVLSNLLPKAEYGRVEWAQACAALVSNWATMGTIAVLPLVIIVGESEATLLGIYAHNFAVGALAFLLSGLLWLSGARPEFCLAALFTAALSLQSLWSTELKTEGRAEASIFLQAGLFTLLAASVALVVFGLRRDPSASIWVIGLLYTILLLVVTAHRARLRIQSGEALRYAQAIQVGAPLMIATAFTVMATTSDRFCIGLLTSPSVTAEYAVLARGAAAPIVAHQLLSIAKFRQVFEFSEDKLDALIAQILCLVTVAGVAFLVCYPWVGRVLGHAFVESFNRHRAVAVCILGSEILWSGIALNDLVFTRHQIMKRILPWTGSCLLLAYPAAYFLLTHWGITINHFALLYVAVMATYFLCQVTLLFRHGIRHYRSFAVAICSVTGFLIYAWTQR